MKCIAMRTRSDDEWYDGDISTVLFPVSDIDYLVERADIVKSFRETTTNLSSVEFYFGAYWVSEDVDDIAPENDSEVVVLDVDVDTLTQQRVELDVAHFWSDGTCQITCYVKHTNVKIRSELFDPQLELKAIQND